MKRFFRSSIGKTLLVLIFVAGCFGLSSIQSFADSYYDNNYEHKYYHGMQYWKAYNAIVKGIIDRGGPSLAYKPEGELIYQTDLNDLRMTIYNIARGHCINLPSIQAGPIPNNDPVAPFSNISFLKSNYWIDGKLQAKETDKYYFTKIPAEYTKNNQPIYFEEDFNWLDCYSPILPIHFQEMADILNLMKYRVVYPFPAYYWGNDPDFSIYFGNTDGTYIYDDIKPIRIEGQYIYWYTTDSEYHDSQAEAEAEAASSINYSEGSSGFSTYPIYFWSDNYLSIAGESAYHDFKLCAAYNCTLEVLSVPGAKNVYCYLWSRDHSYDYNGSYDSGVTLSWLPVMTDGMTTSFNFDTNLWYLQTGTHTVDIDGFCIIESDYQPIILPKFDEVIGDSNSDGLVTTDCSCITCKKTIKQEFDELSGCNKVQFPLGVSGGQTTGLRLLSYISQFELWGRRYQHYSLSTSTHDNGWYIDGNGWYIDGYDGNYNNNHGIVTESDGNQWKINYVYRPQGGESLLLWYWENGQIAYAKPLNGCNYKMLPSGTDAYQLEFSNGVSHIFDSTTGNLVEVQKKVDGEILKCSLLPEDLVTTAQAWNASGNGGDGTNVIVNNLTDPNEYWTYISAHIYSVASPLGTAYPEYDANHYVTSVRYEAPDSTPMDVLSYGQGTGTPAIASSYGGGSLGSTGYSETLSTSNGVLESAERVFTYPDQKTVTEGYNIVNGAIGSVATVIISEITPVTGSTDVILTKTTISGSSTSVQTTRYKVFGWGQAAIEQVSALGTNDERTASYGYYDSQTTDGAAYSRQKYQISPDGSWSYYTYDTQGRTAKVITPFGNNTLGSGAPSESANRVTEYSYDPVASGDTTYSGDTRARCIVSKVNGSETSRRYNVYLPNEYRSIACRTPGAAWNASDNLVTVSYSYTSGDFSGRKWKTVYPDGTLSITSYAKNGSNLTTTIEQGAGSGGTATSGTRTVTVTNAAGNATSSTVSDIASGLTLSSASYTLDAYGRVTRTDYQGGTYSTTAYGCCGPTQQTAQDGSVTTMAYNPLKQLDHEASAGITTFYSYDAQGNIVSTTVKGTDNSELTTTNTYNAAGWLVSTTAPGNQTTTYAESWADGVRYNTTTYPGGLTSIEKYNLDGTLAELSGTAVHPVKYEYGVANGELYTKAINVGDNNALDQWQKSFVNMAGNTYKTVYADNTSSQAFFDSVNRQIKQVSPSGIASLTAYNSDGDVSSSAIDMNRNDTIDYSGPDRVTGYSKAVANKNGVTVRRNVTSVYQDSSSAPTEAAVSEVSADGLNSWQTSFGRTVSSQTVLNGSGQRTITVTNPDGSTVSSVYQNGLMSSSTHSVLGTTTYAYDAFNRPLTVTRTENGGQKTAAYAYNDAGQTVSITENPGNRVTSYVYDNMGRRTSATFPGSRTVNYTYADTGEYLTVTGADTYPQAFTYDTQGRMKTLTTYKTYPGTPEVTTWNYDSARGFMVSKVYPDNKQVTYTNDADGRPLTRVWARGITTTYAYDNGGSLTGVSYSDGATPAISYTLDRMGRVTAVTDASGSRTLSYNADGTLASESIPYIVSGAVEYTYDSLGRRTGLQLKQNSATVFGNNYTYDAMSRLATVSDGTNTATYSRVPGTNLLNTTTITQGANTRLTTTRNYDAQNRLTSISSTAGAVTKTYSYTYDDKDRRSRLDMADGSYWTYTYDAKGQIVSGAKYDSANKAIPGQSFTYSYDDIGNLTSEQRGMAAMQFDYTSNLVNQYTQRTIPGLIPVTGQASADSTISVWLKNHGANAAAVVKPTRDGEYFSTTIPVNNSSANVTEALEITAVKFNTTLDKDVVKTINGTYTVPKTPQLFTYDDWNMTSDGVWNYTWNGENRLLSMEKTGKTRVEAEYDYSGRRVSKKAYSWVNSAWQLNKHLKFAYNGFKLVAEYDGVTNVLLRTYCWNGDKLEWMMNGSTVYYYVIDGNKNVIALVDSTGALAAEYEYDQFGETLSKFGPMSDINPFRFSSEYYDAETGLGYYNFRYYSFDLRRWLNQDPIGEEGGINIYGFCGNNPISNVDLLGLLIKVKCHDLVDKYLNKHQVTGWKQDDDIYHSISGNVGYAKGLITSEILAKMIESPTTFEIKDLSYDNLVEHVTARRMAIQYANGKKYQYGAGANFSVKSEYYTKKGKYTGDASETEKAFNDMNNPDSALACFFATRETMYAANGNRGPLAWRNTSLEDWIPGDWGYIKNENFKKGEWQDGLEGENLIYVGNKLYWGHFSKKSIFTIDIWKNEVNGWMSNDKKVKGKAKVWTEKDFPSIGLQNYQTSKY